MSDFSLTLVLQFKTSKIINDMAKVQIKSEKVTPFGGIFPVRELFSRYMAPIIDKVLGLRCASYGYQYSEIVGSLSSVYFCGGDCVEDVTSHLMPHLSLHPTLRTCSSDTILRGISELATSNTSYTSDTGKSYDFNTAPKLNSLLVKTLINTGQLVAGESYDLDFDHQFLEAEKYDSKRTYKGFDGYSPGVFTIGGLIAYLENRDGNANVRFMQAETHRRFFEMMRSFGIHVRSFRADCGSYSEDIVKAVMEHTEKFYIRAERYAGLYEKVKRQTGWTTVEIGFQRYDVQSFPFESFEDVKHCRLVVQRQRRQKGEQLDLFDGEYTYRCILTNDWDMTDEEIILHYNKRGAAEQVFDRQNNDFGWAHLPKSFMNQNTVFLLITAMAANFYRYIVALPLMAVLFGIKATDRVKSFLFRFIAVPAKWVKTARQYKLNIFSNKPYNLIWEHG